MKAIVFAVVDENGSEEYGFVDFIEMAEYVGRADKVEEMKGVVGLVINFFVGEENISMHAQGA